MRQCLIFFSISSFVKLYGNFYAFYLLQAFQWDNIKILLVSMNIHPRVKVPVKISSTLNITNSSLFKMADILPRFDKRSLTRRALNWNPSVDLSRSIDQGKRERRRENIGWLYWLCVNIFILWLSLREERKWWLDAAVATI